MSLLSVLTMVMLSQADAGVSAATTKPAPAVTAPLMDPAVKKLVDRVQGFYEKTQDFSAHFEQSYTYASFGRTQTSSGEVLFKKPGFMRWNYEKPGKKTFILAQERVLAFDPAAQTLTKTTISSNQLSASVTFLFGKGRLADEFSIRQMACDKCAGTQLEMTPLRPDPRFQRIFLVVEAASGRVLTSTVVDPDGSQNRIEFQSFKANTGAKESDFKLDVPAGTQVVDLSQPR